jgi:hypothetical protein
MDLEDKHRPHSPTGMGRRSLSLCLIRKVNPVRNLSQAAS